MTPELLTRLRKAVEEERESVVAELREYGADPASEKVEHIAGIDDNFADLASATAERSQTLALIETARERLGHCDAALAKLDDGTYGICEVCGEAIPEARLEARPLSVRCVQCASSGR